MDTTQIVAIIIFVVTMFFVMTDRVHNVTASLCGAVMMILCGVLDIEKSVGYIDAEAICILVGMMLFVSVIKKSGLFEYIAIRAAKRAKGEPWKIMLYFVIITAFLSAFLDNVTTVLLIGPMTFAITRVLGFNPVPFIITQIMASNIGGTATLIGDPPNIMIGSIAGLSFMDFLINVAPAVVIVIAVSLVCFYVLYGRKGKADKTRVEELMMMTEALEIKDHALMKKGVVMLILMIAAFIFQSYIGLNSAIIALSAAAIMMLIGRQDIDKVIEDVEWTSIIFFVGLFVVVGGLQECGIIDMLANFIVSVTNANMTLSVIVILWASALLSSFLNNIPFVATMIPLIIAMGNTGMDVMPLWWALSLGACLGGNGTLVGASANVVLAGISAREGSPISFKEYTKVGMPVMLVGIVVSTIYMLIRYCA